MVSGLLLVFTGGDLLFYSWFAVWIVSLLLVCCGCDFADSCLDNGVACYLVAIGGVVFWLISGLHVLVVLCSLL